MINFFSQETVSIGRNGGNDYQVTEHTSYTITAVVF